MLVGVGVADCDAPQSQRHRTFQDTAQPRKDCVHTRGKIARGDIGRANERAPRPMLLLTRAHTSDSRTFGPQFVELAPPWPVGLLNRPIDTATEFAARGPDRPTARPKRSTRRKRSLAAPACRSHALHANRCTAHDRRGHWRSRRLTAGSATETLSGKIPLRCDPDAAMFRERTSGSKAPF